MATTSQTSITGVHTVGVPVTDQDRAVDFYRTHLGLDVRLDEPVEQLGGRWIEMAAPGALTTVALYPTGPGAPVGVETGIRLATSDAVGLHRELGERGVEVGELMQWPGIPPMFGLHDPDGNGLAIVEVPA